MYVASCGGQLGRYCDEEPVVRLLEGLREDPRWAGLRPETLPDLPAPLGTGIRVGEYLANRYESLQSGWLKTVERWRALSPRTEPARWEDLPLGRHCLLALLTRPASGMFRLESPSDLVRWAEAVLKHPDTFRAFAKSYLETIDIDLWAAAVVDAILDRLGDPRLQPERWEGFSDRIIRAIIRRINLGKLDEFFAKGAGDQARFEFWKQFVDHMGPRSEGRIHDGQGFFEFPGFGVIEFMQVGNAAYFYRHDLYYRFLRRGRLREFRTEGPPCRHSPDDP